MSKSNRRAACHGPFVAVALLLQAALGCTTSPPPPAQLDTAGYPLDYPIPPQERYGVCAEQRHPNCHPHHRHVPDEHGNDTLYLWEHAHPRPIVRSTTAEAAAPE
jgi:hypothetical protein